MRRNRSVLTVSPSSGVRSVTRWNSKIVMNREPRRAGDRLLQRHRAGVFVGPAQDGSGESLPVRHRIGLIRLLGARTRRVGERFLHYNSRSGRRRKEKMPILTGIRGRAAPARIRTITRERGGWSLGPVKVPRTPDGSGRFGPPGGERLALPFRPSTHPGYEKRPRQHPHPHLRPGGRPPRGDR